MAKRMVGDALMHATQLHDVEGSVAGSLVVAEEAGAGGLRSLLSHSPFGGLRRWLAGADRSLFEGDGWPGEKGFTFLELVLDEGDPPVAFDDPTVMGIYRDQHAWYLPLLGPRHIACGALIADGVRAAGSFVAFSAASVIEAEWLAAVDPWRRVAPGRLLELPPGVFSPQAPPPGPGVQRMGSFICGHPESAGEPG